MSRAASGPVTFFFVAARSGGGRKLGVRQAGSARALAEGLRKERLLLLRSYQLPSWLVRERPLRLSDHVELNGQLQQLLSRGVPLVETLDVVAQTVSATTRPVVERIRRLVADGASFGDACERVGAFDVVTVAVYRAAEKSGDLAGAAKQLATNARRLAMVRSKIITLMMYPAVVMAVSVIVAAVMFTVIVPRVGASILSLDVELPWYTEAMLAASDFTRQQWPIVLATLGVLVVATLVWRRWLGSALRAGVRQLPAVREVVLASESARFFSIMSAMTRSGVVLADALGVSNRAINLPELRRQLDTLRERLIAGGVLRNLVEEVTALPLATRRLLIAAERSGDLDTAFDGLALDMADELDRRATRLIALLEPALIVGMFAVIGSMYMAIMVPLMTLANKAV